MTVAAPPADVWTIAAEVLTERQLRCFELRERHGMSVYSIAYALDVHPSTVRGHLHAAARNVRRGLDLAADEKVSICGGGTGTARSR